MGNAKVNLLVLPGKKLQAAQFPSIKKALIGKSFPMVIEDKQLTSDDVVADRSGTAEEILELIRYKAPELKNAFKIIVETSQFKKVPDECTVMIKIDGDKEGSFKSTVTLDPPRRSDLTKRFGYKDTSFTLVRDLDGEKVYGKVDLKDLLVCPNPQLEATVRVTGPETEDASRTRFVKIVDDAMANVTAKVGGVVTKSVGQIKKLTEKEGDVDGAELKKQNDLLNKLVGAEIGKLQPMIMKELNGSRSSLQGKDPAVAAIDFECTVMVRFIRFQMSPALIAISEAGDEGGGKKDEPSLNDKQVRPLALGVKEALVPLRRDVAQRKLCVNGIRPFLRALAYQGEGDAAALAGKASAAHEAFVAYLEDLSDGIEELNQRLERIAKNSRLEKPTTKDSKEEQAKYKDILVDFRDLKKLIGQREHKIETAMECMNDVEELLSAAKDGANVPGRTASQVGRKLELVLKNASTTREISRFKLLTKNVLDFID